MPNEKNTNVNANDHDNNNDDDNNNNKRIATTTTSLLPDFIVKRIDLCINTFNVIMKSKPDKFHTSIVVISNNENTKMIKEHLLNAGIAEQYLETDTNSKSIEAVINSIVNRIKKLPNPPVIYFVGSIWQKDALDSISISKLKGYKVIFEGALDHRPFDIIQKEKLNEAPGKDSTYYKQKISDKAKDILLNYIFPNKQK